MDARHELQLIDPPIDQEGIRFREAPYSISSGAPANLVIGARCACLLVFALFQRDGEGFHLACNPSLCPVIRLVKGKFLFSTQDLFGGLLGPWLPRWEYLITKPRVAKCTATRPPGGARGARCVPEQIKRTKRKNKKSPCSARE